jgi:hypothetical protein
MLLRHWTHNQKKIEFSPLTGEAKTILLKSSKSTDSTCLGFSHCEKKLFGSKVIFNAGKKSWDTGADGIQFKHSTPYPFISKFQVIENGNCTFSILYSHLGRALLSLIDVTYDQLDKDADFYLEYMAEVLLDSEWRATAKDRWGQHKVGSDTH